MPTHVPVCVLGNYRDMGEHRVILPDDVRDFIDHLDRWVLPAFLLYRGPVLCSEIVLGKACRHLGIKGSVSSCVGDKMSPSWPRKGIMARR